MMVIKENVEDILQVSCVSLNHKIATEHEKVRKRFDLHRPQYLNSLDQLTC